MAEAKTQKTTASVPEFLAEVPDARRREDALALCELMTEVTGVQPAMWGGGIVGFGSYSYIYATGRTGDWPAVAFSPRKQNVTLYLTEGIAAHTEMLARLGPHTTSKACLYLKRLSDVDADVLRELVGDAFTQVNGKTITT